MSLPAIWSQHVLADDGWVPLGTSTLAATSTPATVPGPRTVQLGCQLVTVQPASGAVDHIWRSMMQGSPAATLAARPQRRPRRRQAQGGGPCADRAVGRAARCWQRSVAAKPALDPQRRVGHALIPRPVEPPNASVACQQDCCFKPRWQNVSKRFRPDGQMQPQQARCVSSCSRKR